MTNADLLTKPSSLEEVKVFFGNYNEFSYLKNYFSFLCMVTKATAKTCLSSEVLGLG